jgi:hypothetical protein
MRGLSGILGLSVQFHVTSKKLVQQMLQKVYFYYENVTE